MSPLSADGCSPEHPECAAARRRLGHNGRDWPWYGLTSRFTPTWDILNARSAAAQGFRFIKDTLEASKFADLSVVEEATKRWQ
jgi:hypothetical protein